MRHVLGQHSSGLDAWRDRIAAGAFAYMAPFGTTGTFDIRERATP